MEGYEWIHERSSQKKEKNKDSFSKEAVSCSVGAEST
jgi:hypothetical protein